MLLRKEDVVFVEPTAFRYLRWTYVLAEADLSDAAFALAFQKYYADEANFVALKQNGLYNLYVAAEGDLPPTVPSPPQDQVSAELVEEYIYYRGAKTKRLVKPLPSLMAQNNTQVDQTEGEYIYYRGAKTKIVR